ncbi:aldo/keto reductase [Streptococcus ovuberis]|uniref:Aldo/keto reductase n=1 Tax=Streptococcus ovuberis TaxID=1936207 RepID=A0A7X6N0N1_9STRE|nr:aldo/keto reductase [Streptococcus ovuberis]NKZ19899.1 aldo/keto reductase [Streptococcus ovuberis]
MVKQIAPIVLGTWSWGTGGFAGGNVVFGNHLDTADVKEVVAVAMEQGLNTFDTAFAYANGESERILGELVGQYDRSAIILSDKFTPGMRDDSKENPVEDMLEGSLNRLGTDYIDIYWIHNASDVERWTPFLAGLVTSGRVKRIGVSNHSLEQVKRVQEILKPTGVQISAVQNHFSLLYRNAMEDGLLDYCKENDIQFFSYMVLEQGALSGKYNSQNLMPADSNRGRTYNPLFPALADLLAELQRLATNYQVTPAQIATAWAIGRGTTPILGVTKVEQVLDAAKASQMTLSADEMVKLEDLALQAGVNTRGGWEGQA